MANTHYDTLGVDRGSSLAEIKAAYRRVALSTHPDKNSGKEDQFKRALEAYNTLKDRAKRQEYDMALEQENASKTQSQYYQQPSQSYRSPFEFHSAFMAEHQMPSFSATPRSFFAAFDTFANVRNIFNLRPPSFGASTWSPFDGAMPGSRASTRPAQREAKQKRRTYSAFHDDEQRSFYTASAPQPSQAYQRYKKQKQSMPETDPSLRKPPYSWEQSRPTSPRRRPTSRPAYSKQPEPPSATGPTAGEAAGVDAGSAPGSAPGLAPGPGINTASAESYVPPNAANPTNLKRPIFVDLSESESEDYSSHSKQQARTPKQPMPKAPKPDLNSRRSKFTMSDIHRDINDVELSDEELVNNIGSTFGDFNVSSISPAETKMLQASLNQLKSIAAAQEKLRLQTIQIKQALEKRQRGQMAAIDLCQTVEPLKNELQLQFNQFLSMQQTYRDFENGH